MPELPEVEITARRLSSALEGAEVESALAPGVATLKTFEPSLDALTGARITGVRRIGKMLAVDLDPSVGNGAGALTLLIHLMSAGRLQLFDKRASLKDRRSRLLVRIADGRELRLREFGTKQAAWAKLLRRDEVDDDEMVATLGPDAWPAPPLDRFREAIDEPATSTPCCVTSAKLPESAALGSTRSSGKRSSRLFKKGSELRGEEVKALHDALHVLGDAIDHYEEVIDATIPDKMPMPLQVHRREGEPCPRCGTTIEAVFFAEHQMNYCPEEQTGGRVLKEPPSVEAAEVADRGNSGQVEVIADLHRTFSERDVEGFVAHLDEDAVLRPSALIAGREEYRGYRRRQSGVRGDRQAARIQGRGRCGGATALLRRSSG